MAKPHHSYQFTPKFLGNIGTPMVDRGDKVLQNIKQKVKLSCWDAIPACAGEACPVFGECPYKRLRVPQYKCSVRFHYIKRVITTLFSKYQWHISELKLMRMGLELIPLYDMLCRMKMQALVTERVINITDRGTRQADPIFKEIRDTIFAIERLTNYLGLDKVNFEEGDSPSLTHVDPMVIPMSTGENVDPTKSNYYEMMAQDAEDYEARKAQDPEPKGEDAPEVVE